MNKHVSNTDVTSKAFLSWEMDLAQIEESLGVIDPVNTLPVKMDARVPAQGSVLWDRIAYLPKEGQ